MQLTQHESYIQSYDNTQITINNVCYHQTLLVTAKQVITTWPIHDINQLDTSHLLLVMQQQPEIVILGCGEKQQLPNSTILQFFAEHQTGIEIMNTGAACRTFNILQAENRRVVAILIIPHQENNHETKT